jgi:hypothetical protein
MKAMESEAKSYNILVSSFLEEIFSFFWLHLILLRPLASNDEESQTDSTDLGLMVMPICAEAYI